MEEEFFITKQQKTTEGFYQLIGELVITQPNKEIEGFCILPNDDMMYVSVDKLPSYLGLMDSYTIYDDKITFWIHLV
jgi:hypothetical protein